MAEVVVVGAGPAGLAAARELATRGIRPRVLERGPTVAHTWKQLYDSLMLHTGKHLSSLPGLAFSRTTPLFPSRTDFIDYLLDYASRFHLAVETGTEVRRVRSPNGAGWTIETSLETVHADAIVWATGIVANPYVPAIPGRDRFHGRVIHSVDYRRADPFIGRAVLVIGAGNSGAEIASELAVAGARVSVAVRSGANVVPLTLFGIPIQYHAMVIRALPGRMPERIAALVGRLTQLRRGPPVLPRPAHGPLDAIPIIGFHLVDAIRAGTVRVLPGIDAFTAAGARFTNGIEHAFDDVILATGYRPALDPLDGLIRTDVRGFALRSDRVSSADHDTLFFVGLNYDATGGLRNIGRDARLAADAIARRVR